jgi:hypothetical protein
VELFLITVVLLPPGREYLKGFPLELESLLPEYLYTSPLTVPPFAVMVVDFRTLYLEVETIPLFLYTTRFPLALRTVTLE